MTAVLNSRIFWVTLTLVIFFGAQFLYKKTKFFLLNPVLITLITLIFLLKISNTSYETYFNGGQLISFFLAPAVVALGVPLYLELEQIKKNRFSILLAIFCGSLVGIVSVIGIAYILGASKEVIISLAPKSVTTPIAMEVSRIIGGIPSLTAAIVVIVGIIGSVFGFPFMKLCRIKSPKAAGLAMGTAAHGLGTARAAEKGTTQAAYSGIALCLTGLFTALMTPFIMKLFFIIIKK